ncbi:hypothetical protein B1R94_02210 [Mycolicibacterium litorale]|nr:hypothetical protein B1R94_02210 [Mycolicibacterium litorale]
MTNWRLQAACRSHDPDLWFPERGDKRTKAAALRICRTCPVIAACRDYALRTGQPDGIWGGLTQTQRTKLLGVSSFVRRTLRDSEDPDRRLKPCGTPAAYERHRRRREPICDPCRKANTRRHIEAQKQRRARDARPASTQQETS